MSPLETALTFYLVTGILGCLALTIYGHRRIIDVALGLLVVALIGAGVAQPAPSSAPPFRRG